MGPIGRTKTTQYNDVRSLIKDHLRLEEGDEPNLSIAEGVLSGGGKSKDSVRMIFIFVQKVPEPPRFFFYTQ